MDARQVPICEVLIHDSLGLCIIPKPPSDYRFVYRAAQSACWSNESRMLYLRPIEGWAYLDVFKCIVGAVAEEYSDRLFVNGETVWTRIPASVRANIEALGLPADS